MSDTKTYRVSLPFSGVAHLTVESDGPLTDQEAIDKAWDEAPEMEELLKEGLVEYEYAEVLVRGNVFYGHTNEADVEEDS